MHVIQIPRFTVAGTLCRHDDADCRIGIVWSSDSRGKVLDTMEAPMHAT